MVAQQDCANTCGERIVNPTGAALSLDHVSIVFGGLKAVSDLCLDVHPGELVGLIGPNGAGKTTVFNLISGVYVPTSGTIRFGETVLNGRRPHAIATWALRARSRTRGCSPGSPASTT